MIVSYINEWIPGALCQMTQPISFTRKLLSNAKKTWQGKINYKIQTRENRNTCMCRLKNITLDNNNTLI